MSDPRLLKLIILTSAYYGQKLEDQIIAMYCEDLSDLPYEEVERVVKEIRRDPKINRFPLPAVIRDRITPAETTDADAREAVSRIVEAVSKFGWNNADRAKEFIGELGWEIVKRQGGWANVCQQLNEESMTSLQAQWRELAKSIYIRSRAGTYGEAPELPEVRNQPKLESFNSILKQITQEKT